MSAARAFCSSCRKRAWQYMQQEGLTICAAGGLGGVCSNRTWQWVQQEGLAVGAAKGAQ